MSDRDLPPPGNCDLTDAFKHAEVWRQEGDRLEQDAITRARNAGWTWRQIACQLGLDSPQAAQQRAESLERRVRAARTVAAS